jgi:hypothetical protein
MRLLLLFAFFSNLNTYSQELDTFNIYQDSSEIKYKIYLKNWFPKTQSYSYFANKSNMQDSIALSLGDFYFKKYYLKVFDKKHRLILEGLKGEYGDLIGKVKHYYTNGQVKRIENYEVVETEAIDSTIYGLYDRYGPNCKWEHFSKKGKLKKEENYYLKKVQNSPVKIQFIHDILIYKKNGEIKSKDSIVLYSFPR